MKKNKTELCVLTQSSALRTLLVILSLCFLITSCNTAARDYQAGKNAYERRDYATAGKIFLRLHQDHKHPPAQHHLGWMYYHGQGVKADTTEAVYYFEMAAKQGYAPAENALSLVDRDRDFQAGRNTYEQDNYKTALEIFFQLHQDHKYAPAQHYLGRMCYYGQGVKADTTMAEYFFEMAAKQGYAPAENALSMVDRDRDYQAGKNAYEQDNYKTALEIFLRLHQSHKYPPAQYYLGRMYYYGQGVDQNLVEAVKWLQKAQKEQDAQLLLDRIVGAKFFATLKHGWDVTSMTFSPDGKTLVSGGEFHTFAWWNVNDALRSPHPDPYPMEKEQGWDGTHVAFSPDGRILARSRKDNTIELTIPNSPPVVYLKGHDRNVTSMAFSPNSKILASGDGKIIILWNVAEKHVVVNGKDVGLKWTYPTKQDILKRDAVTSVAFSPDSRILASGSNDKTIILWDVEKRPAIAPQLKGHTGYVTSVAFSPNGKILASGSNDETIILWDAESGRAIAPPLKGHTDYVTSVAFSPDDSILASGSNDSTIILWDVEKRHGIAMLKGHDGYVTSVAFSPDGSILASGSNDDTIKLWETKSGCAIVEAIFSDSTYVLNAGETKTLKIRIRNDGFDDARYLTVRLSGDLQGVFAPRSIDVPIIPKGGGEKTVDIPISAGDDRLTGKGLLNIHVDGPHFKDKIEGKQFHYQVRASGYVESNPVENIVFESEQTEKGSVPTDMKITMTKEVNAVRVDRYAAAGAGKNWSIKLEKLKLEDRIQYSMGIGERISMNGELMRLLIEWTNKDGTIGYSFIAVHVEGKKIYKNDGTSDDPQLMRVRSYLK